MIIIMSIITSLERMPVAQYPTVGSALAVAACVGGVGALSGYIFSTIHPIGGAIFGAALAAIGRPSIMIVDSLPIQEGSIKTALKVGACILAFMTIPPIVTSLFGFPLTLVGTVQHLGAMVGTCVLLGPLEVPLACLLARIFNSEVLL